MTLEVLFSQAAQGRIFLLMVLCGFGLALAVQLAGFLHQLTPLLGQGGDLLCIAGLTAVLGQILLGSGEGLRLYGLLGLCIGAVLYTTGIAPVADWCAGKIRHRKHKGGHSTEQS